MEPQILGPTVMAHDWYSTWPSDLSVVLAYAQDVLTKTPTERLLPLLAPTKPGRPDANPRVSVELSLTARF